MTRVVVVLPSNTYRAADFVSAADSIGVDLIVASENPPPLAMGDRYVEIDCTNPEAAAEDIATHGERADIDAVIAADDGGVLVAAHATSKLGLAGNSPEAAALTRDKLAMRRRLEAFEVDQPDFKPMPPDVRPSDVADALGYPLVVKPLGRAASQGVIGVRQPDELDRAVARVRAIVGESETLLLERYVPGVEIAVEGLVADGALETLAVFDKPDTSTGPFFPETIFVTPSRLPGAVLDEADRVATSAVKALGLTRGPVHIELRIDDDRARVIEVAARSIGGLCSRSLNFGLMGTSLETLILRNALDMTKKELRREQTASGVLMVPVVGEGRVTGFTGEAETRAIPAVTGIDYTVTPGERVLPPPEGDRYIAFVYARATHPEQVESALREAMGILEVQLEG